MAVTLDITGKTKVLGCIAHPIAHVRAPMLFNGVFEAQGIDAVMVPVHAPPENLPAVIAGLKAQPNFIGLTITVPHKIEIMKLCDDIGDSGRLVGAVNCGVFTEDRRFIGDMYDGKGFVAGMRLKGYEVTGKSVLQIGSGGAGRAIAFELAAQKVERLVITNRTQSKAEELAAAVSAAHPDVSVTAGANDPRGFDIVVNATTLGLNPDDPLPLDPDLLRKDNLVVEIIMIPETTKLLATAIEKGISVHYGRHMLDTQVGLISKLVGLPVKV